MFFVVAASFSASSSCFFAFASSSSFNFSKQQIFFVSFVRRMFPHTFSGFFIYNMFGLFAATSFLPNHRVKAHSMTLPTKKILVRFYIHAQMFCLLFHCFCSCSVAVPDVDDGNIIHRI